MKRRRVASREQQLGLILALGSILGGCYSHLRGPVPEAPPINAPRPVRVAYYNQYRPVEYLHTEPGTQPVYGALRTPALRASLLANGMEIHSPMDLSPAVIPGTEFDRCVHHVQTNRTTQLIGSIVFGLVIAGGAGVAAVGTTQGSPAIGIVGGSVAFVGMLGWPFMILLTNNDIHRRTDRAMMLYDPLLRTRLGLERENPPVDRPQGEVPSCQ